MHDKAFSVAMGLAGILIIYGSITHRNPLLVTFALIKGNRPSRLNTALNTNYVPATDIYMQF